MASVNKVIIIGNLGRAPELRYLASGDAVANLAIATSYKTKDKNTGEQRELTEWHRITLFGRMAELASQYLAKGSSVYIEGRLQTRKYTDKDGVEKYATDIIAEDMKFLDKRENSGQDQGQQAPAPRPQQQRPSPTPRQSPPAGDGFDDCPF